MRHIRLRRPSPALIISVLALIIATSGTSWAALRITSAQIANNTIRSVDVRDNSLLSRDIKNGTIGWADLAAGLKKRVSTQGPPGARGERGEQGPPGPAGAPGVNGNGVQIAFNEPANDLATKLADLPEPASTIASASTTIERPSRVLVTAHAEVESDGGGPGFFGGSCVLWHKLGSAAETLMSSHPTEVVGPTGSRTMLVKQHSAVVQPGSYSVYLRCSDTSEMPARARKGTISIVVAPQ